MCLMVGSFHDSCQYQSVYVWHGTITSSTNEMADVVESVYFLSLAQHQLPGVHTWQPWTLLEGGTVFYCFGNY